MPASSTATAATRTRIVEMPLLFKGDVVTINPTRYSGQDGKKFVVHNPKRSNAHIKPLGEPEAVGYDVDMSALIKTGDTCIADIHAADETRRTKAAAAAVARAEATPRAGAVVRLNSKCGKYAIGALMSVEKVNSTTISLNRLGGNNADEFGMRIDPRGVTIVNLADLAAALG